jgi:hypothetical protein
VDHVKDLHTEDQKSKPIIDTVRTLKSWVRPQCQLRIISLRTVLPLDATGAQGSDLCSQVSIGSDCWKQLSHRLRSQCQPAMLPSAPSQPIPLRHRPSFTPLQNNSHCYWSVHCNLCTYCLLANGKASDSDFIEQIPLCVYKALKEMCHKYTKHNLICGRPPKDHHYKNFPNKVKIQCSYNSHCGIPHVLQ